MKRTEKAFSLSLGVIRIGLRATSTLKFCALHGFSSHHPSSFWPFGRCVVHPSIHIYTAASALCLVPMCQRQMQQTPGQASTSEWVFRFNYVFSCFLSPSHYFIFFPSSCLVCEWHRRQLRHTQNAFSYPHTISSIRKLNDARFSVKSVGCVRMSNILCANTAVYYISKCCACACMLV